MELYLLGSDEYAQLFVDEHGDDGQDCALDEVERQHADEQIHTHAGDMWIDSRAELENRIQIPTHAVDIERDDQEIVGQHAHARHSDRTGGAADNRHLAGLVCAVNQNGDDNERGQHQEIGGLTRTGGLRLGQVDEVLDADHRDSRCDAENERADEHDSAREINLEKRRHERNRKLEIHHDGRNRREHRRARDFFCLCHNSFPLCVFCFSVG